MALGTTIASKGVARNFAAMQLRQAWSRAVGTVIAALSCTFIHCAHAAHGTHGSAVAPLASRSIRADVDMVRIPGGASIAGSTPAEREAAYQASLATSGSDSARRNHWFDVEAAPHPVMLGDFSIDRRPVTQAQFAGFVHARHLYGPVIGREAWRAQGFRQNYDTEVVRFLWRTDQPPAGRDDHPVVLVTWAEADEFCRWRGARLPTAEEYEKAARGVEGRVYPWGDDFAADRLNSGVAGPGDTVRVGSFPDGASPYGVLDMAGNVFHWTSTPWPGRAAHMTVKGSAWDDFAGLGRGAALHSRLRTARHVLVGFRCAM